MRNLKNTLVAILAMALVPSSVFAVDGVVLINQSTVVSSGGFPYTITTAGSYKLSGNLVVPSGVNGVAINADNVTIDLNGFSITGGALLSAQSTAFVGANRKRIRIMNGTMSGILGFSFLGTSQHITIEGISLDSTMFLANGTPVGTVAAKIGHDVPSYAIIRGLQTTGQVQLTCPGLVIDSTGTGSGIVEFPNLNVRACTFVNSF